MQQGHEVYALVPAGKEKDLEHIRQSGIKLIAYPYERNMMSIGANIGVVRYFIRVFREHRFDLIHSFKFQPNLYAVLARLFSPKSFLVLHITGLGLVFTKERSFKLRLFQLASKLIFLFNFIFASRIVFQNPDDEADLWLTGLFSRKLTVIEGSGVDIEKFDRKHFDPVATRQQLQLAPDKFILTFISRLVWQKGIREVVQAVEELSAEHPKLQLLVVGDSDKSNPQAVSEAFIQSFEKHPNITFLGRRSDIPEILSITDLYVYPSYYREGLPRTVLESLATGIPIITTDMPGCNLTIEEGKNGYLIGIENVQEIKDAILKVYQSGRAKEMGAHSRHLAETKFQNKIVYQRIYDNYLQLFNGN